MYDRMNENNDVISKFTEIITGFFFTAVFIFINGFYFFEIAGGGDPWKTGDWLIHYGDGFVRRGAAGAFAMFLSGVFGLDVLWTAAVMQSLALLSVFILVLVIFYKYKRSGVELMILLSPAFLLFPFYELWGGMRKEILIFIPFLIYIYYLMHKKLTGAGIVLVFVLYTFALFSHELAVFVLPFFLLATYLFSYLKVAPRRRLYLIATAFTVVAGIALVASTVYSGEGKSVAICNELIARGLDPDICSESIRWLEYDAAYATTLVLNNIMYNGYIFTYTSALVLSLLPFFFLKSVTFREKYVWGFAAAALLFMLPLFVVSFDWGRWIHLYMFFISVLTFALVQLGFLQPRIKIPPVLIVVYAFFWSIPLCCTAGLTTGMGIYFMEFFKRLYPIL